MYTTGREIIESIVNCIWIEARILSSFFCVSSLFTSYSIRLTVIPTILLPFRFIWTQSNHHKGKINLHETWYVKQQQQQNSRNKFTKTFCTHKRNDRTFINIKDRRNLNSKVFWILSVSSEKISLRLWYSEKSKKRRNK